MVASRGGRACVVAPRGGMRGCSGGACVVAPGACMVARGGCGCSGGACVVAWGGMYGCSQGGMWDTKRYGDTINERAVRILLECILVTLVTSTKFHRRVAYMYKDVCALSQNICVI